MTALSDHDLDTVTGGSATSASACTSARSNGTSSDATTLLLFAALASQRHRPTAVVAGTTGVVVA